MLAQGGRPMGINITSEAALIPIDRWRRAALRRSASLA
ncbi:hypothetical protein I545_1340 [Mycobacterium kansasii 662]|uniref:Uncharacterized protein n=3 Tax=Mycobacterium kansasii TaxID=1768 RepID=A0A1V3XST3_MYCKA|nr:hypothetical protein MKAN_25705 [Mycobacterium kansasii ATCC 12478]EUA00271.1 hypothetical protein I547_5270 [Mycobacterium kansasii 824]EUA22060.1 hypothetical protein I545_1340 [Mycobacterium kansasii 662]KEP42556.1 hypothetical protein MKSMC1_22420 [Mycobacterium kansasii]OOK66163.1 hypothetical protein BZL29_7661 [Mycobacterium kansasii]